VTVLEDLRRWTALANQAAYDLEGDRSTCILTSCALAEFLRLQGLPAQVFRAEAHAHLSVEFERRLGRAANGAAVGWDGDGTRRPKSDGWYGHLAVSCGDYVLDPTLDQLQAEGCSASPAVFAKPDGYDDATPRVWHEWSEGDLTIRHARHPRQMGWKSKPAARPRVWREVVAVMIEQACEQDFTRLVQRGAADEEVRT
jgi:hypothetical protein